jgi:hypothetical protein
MGVGLFQGVRGTAEIGLQSGVFSKCVNVLCLMNFP